MIKIFWLVIVFFLLITSSCTVNKAKINDDLGKYFDSANVDGCFALLDNANGDITVYNMKLDTQRILPASTFKIVNSLIGLETGRITDQNMLIKWDGKEREVKNWNQDLTMEQAFKFSAVPYYQEIARRIGKDTMQYWIDTLRYGNQLLGDQVDTFWLNNTLKISPDEQLGLVKRLYFDQLPFSKRSQEIVKRLMVQEDNTLYKLSYKTGWGFDEQNNDVGWIVGWIEENRHVYFIATLIKAKDKNIDMPAVRLNVTKGILKELGFLKGEK
jgi:beta-lactamase class D